MAPQLQTCCCPIICLLRTDAPGRVTSFGVVCPPFSKCMQLASRSLPHSLHCDRHSRLRDYARAYQRPIYRPAYHFVMGFARVLCRCVHITGHLCADALLSLIPSRLLGLRLRRHRAYRRSTCVHTYDVYMYLRNRQCYHQSARRLVDLTKIIT